MTTTISITVTCRFYLNDRFYSNKGNENWFELAGVRVIEGSGYRG